MTYYSGDEMSVNAHRELGAYGIPDPKGLIGQQFTCTVSEGSHQFLAVGSFTGFAWSDESGIQLFVSVPEYRGLQIKYITISDHQWQIRVVRSEEEEEQFLDQADDGQELIELHAALMRFRFIPITTMEFDGL